MQVLENFKHADTFVQMSMSDKLIATGYVIILGMGITFIALVLIWWITVLMSKTIHKLEARTNLTEVKSQSSQKQVLQPAPINETVTIDDESELVAVITAAIASSLSTSVSSIRVTNIRRIVDATPTWGKSGRNDVMNARF
ncbi:MAG TPA: OadG family protein [Fusibacter sp.]|nr:OadG family protein [Fusibacter sp.]